MIEISEITEVVIKIPKDKYETLVELNERIKKGESIYKLTGYEKAVANGIPLPKNHGRLIDASQLYTVTNYDNDNEICYVLYEDIENAQTILEAVTGYWIDEADKIDAQYGKHAYKCSKCNKYAEYFVSGTEVWWDRIKPNFCPNCGAKMEVNE